MPNLRHSQDPHQPELSLQLLTWYSTLLLPTLLFKYYYVEATTAYELKGLEAAAEHLSAWRLYFRYLFAADSLDVFIVITTGLLLWRFFKLPIRTLNRTTVLLAFLLGGISSASVLVMGALPSSFTLASGWHWIADDPSILKNFLTAKKLALIPTAVIWTWYPAILVAAAGRQLSAKSRSWIALGAWGLLSVLFVVSVMWGGDAMRPGSDRPAISQGYWSNLVSSMLPAEMTNPFRTSVTDPAKIADVYDSLIYSRGHRAPEGRLVDIPAANRRPRHIVIVTLETAPLKYYPILDNNTLPTFFAMSRHAIVSNHHYGAVPITTLAIFSLISGTYPNPGLPIGNYGNFKSDSLASVLDPKTYESTFIDSMNLDRWADYRSTLSSLGFRTILAQPQAVLGGPGDRYDHRLEQETRSFARALDRISEAESRGGKALVLLSTIFGHHDWPARSGQERIPAREKLLDTARVFDGLMGTFLRELAARGLDDEVIIVVTGDHGLRSNIEFSSLNEPSDYGDLTFNVPLMIYSPGLFTNAVRLPYATSHVDVAPTLLDLVGGTREGRLYHGDSVLEPRLADRITFLWSGAHRGLKPVDGFVWRNHVYSVYGTTNRVIVRRKDSEESDSLADDDAGLVSASEARRIIERGKAVLNDTAAYFLSRVSLRNGLLKTVPYR